MMAVITGKRIEQLIFLLLVAWLLIPVFQYSAFYTNDGSPHLYNSQILKEMMLGNGAVYEPYFQLNTRPEPNWMGHVLLVGLLLFTDPLVAEKLLIAILIGLFMFGYRYLVSSMKKQALWTSYLASVFAYSFPLYIGFFNFYLGLAVLFFTLGFWMRVSDKLNWKTGTMLLFLLLVGFFSHITTFAMTLACIGIMEAWKAGIALINGEVQWKELIRTWGKFLAICVPVLFLTFLFTQAHSGGPIPQNTATFEAQLEDVFAVRPLTIYNHFEEGQIAQWIFAATITTFYLVFVSGLFSWKKMEMGWSGVLKLKVGLTQKNHGFLLLTALFMTAYFTLPDWMSSGGYVHIRLLLVSYILVFLWLSTSKTANWLLVPLLVLGIYSTHQLQDNRKGVRTEQNDMVAEMIEISAEIPEGSVVLPIIEHHHWFFGHASNYLGAFKPLIILDNYEADTRYFPLEWTMNPSPAQYFGHPLASACAEGVKKLEASGVQPNIIVHYYNGTIDYGTDCEVTIEELIVQEYRLTFTSSSGLTKVYKRVNPA